MAPAFDLDAYLATLEAPAIVVKGQKYVGRILSIEEFAPFEEKIRKMQEGGITNEEVLTLCKEYLYKVFPRPTLAKWKFDPVAEIITSPALIPTIQYLFQKQATALSNQTVSLTNGTSSQNEVSK